MSADDAQPIFGFDKGYLMKTFTVEKIHSKQPLTRLEKRLIVIGVLMTFVEIIRLILTPEDPLLILLRHWISRLIE